jgi:hypothetical protein
MCFVNTKFLIVESHVSFRFKIILAFFVLRISGLIGKIIIFVGWALLYFREGTFDLRLLAWQFSLSDLSSSSSLSTYNN